MKKITAELCLKVYGRALTAYLCLVLIEDLPSFFKYAIFVIEESIKFSSL